MCGPGTEDGQFCALFVCSIFSYSPVVDSLLFPLGVGCHPWSALYTLHTSGAVLLVQSNLKFTASQEGRQLNDSCVNCFTLCVEGMKGWNSQRGELWWIDMDSMELWLCGNF